ncbi:MAG: oligoendopeptidase F, partial [Ignavibacteria bacterium CHB3]|nr:oligoendopeptidase F [Ignavibacteria bacterium CHB3]
MKHHKFFLLIILFTILIAVFTFAQSPERKEVPDKYKWNLSDIYPTNDAWQKDVDMLKTDVDKLAAFKGTLGKSADELYT